MTFRLHTFLTGLMALLLALVSASANPTSGGYQLFERAASGISADIQLASLGSFAPPPKTASEYANAPNSRPSHLTSHPNAHTVERHGPQVTDQQLETRALTGVAPDGSTLNGNRIPPLSSAFHSEGAMLRADNLMRGRPLQDAIAANPSATSHTITFDVGENVGRGYRRIGSSNPNNVGRNGPPERVDGLTHAQARVELNQSTGEWETITMFPTLP